MSTYYTKLKMWPILPEITFLPGGVCEQYKIYDLGGFLSDRCVDEPNNVAEQSNSQNWNCWWNWMKSTRSGLETQRHNSKESPEIIESKWTILFEFYAKIRIVTNIMYSRFMFYLSVFYHFKKIEIECWANHFIISELVLFL